MSELLRDRSLTIKQLMEGGVSHAVGRFAKAETDIAAYETEGESQKGFLLAMCASLSKAMRKNPDFEKAFLDLMETRKTTIPKPSNAKKDKSSKKVKPVNECLYFLRTLFGKMEGSKWTPNRTYDNWAGPLRYLVSLEIEEIADFLKIIDDVSVAIDGKTYRRVEALRRLDWEKYLPDKRASETDEPETASAPVDIPRGVDRVKPLASFKQPAGAISVNEDGFGLAAIAYRNGDYFVLFGTPDMNTVVHVVASSYEAQKELLERTPVMVPLEKVAPASVDVKQSEEA
jgi:uncharacterized protein (UPF0218 family)